MSLFLLAPLRLSLSVVPGPSQVAALLTPHIVLRTAHMSSRHVHSTARSTELPYADTRKCIRM
jgi:hypothetical protein